MSPRQVWLRELQEQRRVVEMQLRRLGVEVLERSDCPAGTVSRRAYLSPRGRPVEAACIPRRPGSRTDRAGRARIGPLRPGTLGRHGYCNVASLGVRARHRALRAAIAESTALSVFRKLNALWVYNRGINPGSGQVFLEDRDWVRRRFMTQTQQR